MLGVFIKAGIVKAEMDANTGISASMKAEGDGDSAYLYYKAFAFDGVKGKVAIELETGWFGSWGYEREVDLIAGSGGAWPLDGKTKLIG